MPQPVGNTPLNASQRVDRRSAWREAGFSLMLLPEITPAKGWQNLLQNRRVPIIRTALLFKPSVIGTAMPYHLAR